jgi:hypothetical protein
VINLVWKILFFGVLLASHGEVQALEVFDIESPGSEALRGGRANTFSARSDSVYIEGSITTYPPSSVKLDKRYWQRLKIGGDSHFGSNLGVRYYLDVRQNMQVESEEDEPRSVNELEYVRAFPSLDLLFITSGGLEVFAGYRGLYYGPYEKTTTSASSSSQAQFSSVAARAPRFGFVKRAAGWSGGFYFMPGIEQTRDVSITASDGSGIVSSDKVHAPTQMGVFADFSSFGFNHQFEFSALQAGEGGTQTDNNNNTSEDYFRVKYGLDFNIGFTGLNFTAIHKRFSYARNESVSLEQISMTGYHVKWVIGSPDNHLFLGSIIASGKERQSIEEFNADYEIKAVGVSTGLLWKM